MLVKNIKIALAVTISLSFLCLAQTACKIGPANPPDKPTSSSTPTKSGRKHGSILLASSEEKKEAPSTLAPGEKTRKRNITETSKNKQEKDLPNDAGTFTLELKQPRVNEKNCFITVKIKPKHTGIKEKLSITPSITDEGGNVEGKFWWSVEKNNNGSGYKYAKDPDKTPKIYNSLKLGSKQEDTYSFRLKWRPKEGVQQGKVYDLTVEVELGGKTITKNTSWKKRQ